MAKEKKETPIETIEDKKLDRKRLPLHSIDNRIPKRSTSTIVSRLPLQSIDNRIPKRSTSTIVSGILFPIIFN
jgi:hypothetical protein